MEISTWILSLRYPLSRKLSFLSSVFYLQNRSKEAPRKRRGRVYGSRVMAKAFRRGSWD